MSEVNILAAGVPLSRGRSNRAAGWFGDYIGDRGDNDMASMVLVEGIKDWVNVGPEYVRLVDEYDESFWVKIP
jgi:hypothetical protein